jgi:uncharacterized protein (TIGR02099 family)
MTRWIRSIWTQLWLTGVVCLVLLALYTSIGRQLVPLVETLELDIEQALSEQLGIAVDIESLSGDWAWFSPHIQVNNVQLGDIEHGLKIQRLEAKLDVSASLFYRVPVFDQIDLAGVHLPFAQDEQGNWSFSQLSLGSKENSRTAQEFWAGDKPLWLELLGQQGEIHLYNWQVSIQAHNQAEKIIKVLDLRLRNRGLQHWLEGDVKLGKSAARLKMKFEVEGDLWNFAEHNARGYLKLATQEWQPWIPPFKSDWQFEELIAGAKLWVEVENGRIDSLDGYLDIPEFSLLKTLGEDSKDVSFRDGRITLSGRRSDDEWHLWFDSEVDWLSSIVPPNPNGRISWLPNISGGIQLALDDIDLEQTAFWMQSFEIFPEKYMQYITNLQPVGIVDQVRVNLIPEKDWLWGVSMDLVGASITGWKGIPAVGNVNASLNFNATKGILKGQSNDALLHFPDLYEKEWFLSDFNTDIFWQINSEYLRLVSPKLQAGYRQATLKGGFSFYMPLKDSSFEPQLNLLLGIQNLDLVDQKVFVPQKAVAGISGWLNENIKSGQAQQVSFLYSSAISSEPADNSQTIQLYGEVANAEITYLPGWPKVSDIKANLLVDVPDVDVWINKGSTLGGELFANSARVKVRSDENNISWLSLRGKLTGDAQEGIKYFTQTPLQEQMGSIFEHWKVKGAMETELYAQIPLSQKSAPEEQKALLIRLDSQLEDVDIEMTDLGLSFDHIKGLIEFDSEKGLTASGLQGESFSGLTTADISSTKEETGFDIRINAKGQAETKAIKDWLPLFMLKPVSGDLKYDLDMTIRPVERGGLQLDIASDLKGIHIDAPSPLGKTDDKALPFTMSIKKVRDLRIGFRYGELANGVISMEDGDLKRGQVYLGTTKTYLPSDSGLSITGNIPYELDAKEWWDFWHLIKPEPSETKEGANTKGKKAAVLTHIDLSAPEVNAWQQMMGASHITGDYKWNQWDFVLDSELVKGTINLPDDLAANEIKMDLEYIHMPVSENVTAEEIKFGAAGAPDPLKNFDPHWIPNLDMKVAEVFLGTQNFGRWDMTMRQQEEFTRINIKDSLTKSVVVKGDIDWYYHDQEHHTHLNLLRIQTDNLGDVQRAFRKVPAIEAKQSKFDADLRWKGSPAAFNYGTLNGLAKINIKQGVLVSDNAGALKAFGVLNFNTISRRLQLDFSDLYESGVVFDTLKTRLSFADGVANFIDPLWIDGPSAKFQSSGTVNFNTEEIDQKLVVTFPITSSLPLVAVLAGFAPQIAGAIYVTEKLIGEELERFTSASYSVTGTIEAPKMKIDRAFDNALEGKKSRSFKDRFLDIFGLGGDDD